MNVTQTASEQRGRDDCERGSHRQPGRAPGADAREPHRRRPRDVPDRRLRRDLARQGRAAGRLLQGRGLLQLRRQGGALHGGARQHPRGADRRRRRGVHPRHRSRRPHRGVRRVGAGGSAGRWTALEVEFAAVARRAPTSPPSSQAPPRDRRGDADLVRQVLREAGLERGDRRRAGRDRAAEPRHRLGALRSLDSEVDVGVFADDAHSCVASRGGSSSRCRQSRRRPCC